MNITIGMGIILITIGVVAAIIILEAIGRHEVEGKRASSLRLAHRVLGYIFLLIFLAIMIPMFQRLKFWPGDLETRVVFHWILAEVVIAFIIAKIFINRRYKKLYSHLATMGWTILLCTFLLLILTGGYGIIKHSGGKGTRTETEYAQALVQVKCSRCHPTDRVERVSGTEDDIRAKVDRMRQFSQGWITADEEGYITEYLLQRKK